MAEAVRTVEDGEEGIAAEDLARRIRLVEEGECFLRLLAELGVFGSYCEMLTPMCRYRGGYRGRGRYAPY